MNEKGSKGAAKAARSLALTMPRERAERLKARLLNAKREIDAAEPQHLYASVRELVTITADVLDQLEDLRTVLKELVS